MFNHYTFKSGANPFISMTPEADKAFRARCRRRGWHVWEEKPCFYYVEDKDLIVASFIDAGGKTGAAVYYSADDMNADLFGLNFDYVYLKVRGKNYSERQSCLYDLALIVHSDMDLCGLSCGELGDIADFFEREGRKYGLLREFRENAIC